MIYDTIIIGAGPAGLTASIYASRYKLSNLIIGKMVGGTISYAHKVENFPGILSISGVELGQKMAEQAKSFGVEILGENVGRIEPSFAESDSASAGEKGNLDDGSFRVFTETGKEFIAKSLIVSSGTERRKLNVPGEKEYLGKGVSYCTNCDIPFYKDKTVVIVGGSNAACSGAVHAADFAGKVYIVYRKDELRAEPVWIDDIKDNPKIEVLYNTNIVKILGGQEEQDPLRPRLASTQARSEARETGGQRKVTGVELDNEYNGSKILPLDGVFVEIGGVPASSFLVPLGVEMDENGYVKVNEKMETNVIGLFAAGDFTTMSLFLQQTVTACADGAKAAASAFRFIRGQKAPRLLGNSL